MQGISGHAGAAILQPHKIKAELDKDVIGQHHAKRVLSVALFSHMQRTAACGADPPRHSAAAAEVQRLHYTDKRVPPTTSTVAASRTERRWKCWALARG